MKKKKLSEDQIILQLWVETCFKVWGICLPLEKEKDDL